jgi:catechol 2,3-dioxygenase-like lactoylglutathione lyase family enzyme
MEGKIAQVTLVVRDQAAALEFYTQKVGLEKKADVALPGDGRWITVGLKGQDLELALFQLGSRADPRDHTSEWHPGKAPSILIHVADCRKTFDALKAKGVEFRETEPSQLPWGTVATFSDPDGNSFSIVQRPSYPSKA